MPGKGQSHKKGREYQLLPFYNLVLCQGSVSGIQDEFESRTEPSFSRSTKPIIITKLHSIIINYQVLTSCRNRTVHKLVRFYNGFEITLSLDLSLYCSFCIPINPTYVHAFCFDVMHYSIDQ